MIRVEEAINIIKNRVVDFGSEEVSIDKCLGRVLDEDLYADRDFPPFDRVMMDGIAINLGDAILKEKYKVQGLSAAGNAAIKLESENCLEVMTGSVLPISADTVIRYEDVEINDGYASVTVENIKQGQNIHRQGTDKKKGELLIHKARVIRAAEIGVLTSIGKTKVRVKRLPRIMIVSTGDELVEIGKQPLPHQIRRSNVHQVQSILDSIGYDADKLHLQDDLTMVMEQLESVILNYDVLVLSGGVSKGKLDYIPEALEKLGINKAFHKVQQRPGKPFWFGYGKSTTVFALPGNPISTFLCAHKYVLPWLRDCMGIEIPQSFAVLDSEVSFKPDLHYYLEVKVYSKSDGKLYATPMKGNGSGDLSNLTRANAFIELPQGKDVFKKGEVYPIVYHA
jgi:molybdopterin molybdotransferase